ncbi:hypothetical protein ACTXT7_016051 [Hymenolepis weldensis]
MDTATFGASSNMVESKETRACLTKKPEIDRSTEAKLISQPQTPQTLTDIIIVSNGAWKTLGSPKKGTVLFEVSNALADGEIGLLGADWIGMFNVLESKIRGVTCPQMQITEMMK